MTLYEYLTKNLDRSDTHPAIDHTLRVQRHEDGRISFYIHAERRDSDTADFWVSDNGIYEKKENMSPVHEFLSHPKAWRDARLESFAESLAPGS